MSILAGAAVILVLILFLGLSIEAVSVIALWTLGILAGIVEIFFIYVVIKLVATSPVTAKFTKISTLGGKSKIEYAFYKTPKGEFPNIFPCEMVMRDKLYNKEKGVQVRIDAKKGKIYDKNAVTTIIAGFIFFTAAVAAVIICFSVF